MQQDTERNRQQGTQQKVQPEIEQGTQQKVQYEIDQGTQQKVQYEIDQGIQQTEQIDIEPSGQDMQEKLEQFNVEVKSHYRWNYWVNIIDGAFYSFGAGFVSLYTILTLFVHNLSNSKILLGLLTTIAMLGNYLPQIFIANYTERFRSKKRLTAYLGIFQRVPWLGLAVVTFFWRGASAGWLLAIFFFFLAVYSFAGGFTTPPWFDLIAKIIPPDRLGRYVGYRNFACGITEFVGALLAGVILKAIAFPNNFALLFFLTFVATGISFFFFISTREPDYPIVKKRATMKDYLSSLPAVLRQNPNFRQFILALIFVQFFVMGNPLYAASAIESLHLNSAQSSLQVGIFTALMLGFQMVGFPLWGNLSDRWGHRKIILLSAILNIAAAILAILGGHIFLFYLVFIFVGISQAATRISLMAIIPEFCSPEDRPTFLGLANSISGLAVIVASFAGGVLADMFNYRLTFGIMAVFILIGFGILLKYVTDPRRMLNDKG